MKMQRKKAWREAGFSLVELMVVISIIGLLSTIVAVNVLKNKDKANAEKVRADVKAFSDAITLYHNDTGQYPSSLEDLISASVDGWDGPYVKGGSSALMDPWRRPYMYAYGGGNGDYPFDIGSYGGDGAPGGQGGDADVFPLRGDQGQGGGRRR